MLWVQNIAYKPERDRSVGLVTSRLMMTTRVNTAAFATNTASRKCQLTELKSRVAIDMNMSDGSEKVPTNVLRPLASVCVITFILPATYLAKKKRKTTDKTVTTKNSCDTHSPAQYNCKAFYNGRIQLLKCQI